MKILFSHGGVIKLFPLQKNKPDNYENMRNFVQKNFPKIPINFIVKYKDQEGDQIVICSNKDIQALFDNKSSDYVRATIQEESQNDEESNQSNDSDQSNEEQEQSRDQDQEAENQEENKVQSSKGQQLISDQGEDQQVEIKGDKQEQKNNKSVKLNETPESENMVHPHNLVKHGSTTSQQVYTTFNKVGSQKRLSLNDSVNQKSQSAKILNKEQKQISSVNKSIQSNSQNISSNIQEMKLQSSNQKGQIVKKSIGNKNKQLKEVIFENIQQKSQRINLVNQKKEQKKIDLQNNMNIIYMRSEFEQQDNEKVQVYQEKQNIEEKYKISNNLVDEKIQNKKIQKKKMTKQQQQKSRIITPNDQDKFITNIADFYKIDIKKNARKKDIIKKYHYDNRKRYTQLSQLETSFHNQFNGTKDFRQVVPLQVKQQIKNVNDNNKINKDIEYKQKQLEHKNDQIKDQQPQQEIDQSYFVDEDVNMKKNNMLSEQNNQYNDQQSIQQNNQQNDKQQSNQQSNQQNNQQNNDQQNNDQQSFQYNDSYIKQPNNKQDKSNNKYDRQQMLRLFDEQFDKRLQIIIPKLVSKIKTQLNKNHIQQQQSQIIYKSDQPKLIHQISCSNCQTQHIQGIRYKCTQCKQYNLCQQCQQNINHQHNLIKMKHLQIKQQTNPQISKINKLFFLNSYFHQLPKSYQSFVQQNITLNNQELLQKYIQLNKKKLKHKMGPILIQKCQKLGYLFNKNYHKFYDIVRKNPTLTFQQLIPKCHSINNQPQSQSDQTKQKQDNYQQINNFKTLPQEKKSSTNIFSTNIQSKKNQQNKITEQKRVVIKKNQQKSRIIAVNDMDKFVQILVRMYGIDKNKSAGRLRIIGDYHDRYRKSYNKLQQLVQSFVSKYNGQKDWVLVNKQ